MPNGDVLKFESIDGVTGYYSTERPEYLSGFQKMIDEHRGGVSEITEAEFSQFSKKKMTSVPSAPRWREEISGGPLHDTVMSRQVVAAVEPPKAPAGPAVAVDTGKPAAPPSKPRVGKRPPPAE